jgi:hypothetical protein
MRFWVLAQCALVRLRLNKAAKEEWRAPRTSILDVCKVHAAEQGSNDSGRYYAVTSVYAASTNAFREVLPHWVEYTAKASWAEEFYFRN